MVTVRKIIDLVIKFLDWNYLCFSKQTFNVGGTAEISKFSVKLKDSLITAGFVPVLEPRERTFIQTIDS